MISSNNHDLSRGRQIGALAKWAQEAGAAPTTLPEIRLDESERLLVPFAVSAGEATVASPPVRSSSTRQRESACAQAVLKEKYGI